MCAGAKHGLRQRRLPVRRIQQFAAGRSTRGARSYYRQETIKNMNSLKRGIHVIAEHQLDVGENQKRTYVWSVVRNIE